MEDHAARVRDRATTCALCSPRNHRGEAFAAWIKGAEATFVAKDDHGSLVGIYYLKANQPGLGSHVAMRLRREQNSAQPRRRRALCEHSQAEAKRRGFLAMQFNLVVSTNEVAVKLWQKLGFQIVGHIPEAFRHSELGFVDAIVMWKKLE